MTSAGLGPQRVDLRFALHIIFLDWARWRFILPEFSQAKSDLAIMFVEACFCMFKRCFCKPSLTRGGREWPPETDRETTGSLSAT